MKLEQLQNQSHRIEGFREGYMAALNWIASHIEQENKAKEAEKANESVPQA